MADSSSPRIRSLVRLGAWLRRHDYRFVTVTPATHARVLARPGRPETADDASPGTRAFTLRDAFGWNLPFADAELARDLSPSERTELHELLREGDLLETAAHGLQRSRVRFSSLGDGLFAHSAYPTTGEDSVFFGPDTYRFARYLEAQIPEAGHLLDLGCGSGAGGLHIGPRCRKVTLSDVSEHALEFARANDELNGQSPRIVQADGVPEPLEGASPYDAIIVNPPFLVDSRSRTYRHGGGQLGEELSISFLEQSLPQLAPGGRVVMYTGSAIVRGHDRLRQRAEALAAREGAKLHYEEIDPDIFPEELDRPEYARAERICAVGLTLTRS